MILEVKKWPESQDYMDKQGGFLFIKKSIWDPIFLHLRRAKTIIFYVFRQCEGFIFFTFLYFLVFCVFTLFCFFVLIAGAQVFFFIFVLLFCIFFVFVFLYFSVLYFCTFLLLYFVIWLDSPYELPCKIWSL